MSIVWPMLALALLIVGTPARAEVFTIAVFGDWQLHTRCTKGPEAWYHLRDAVHWVADHAVEENIAFAVQLGDLTEDGGNLRFKDCECLALPPDPTCADVVTTASPDGCFRCDNARATLCEGGTPGADCEWTRARNAIEVLESAGIPWATVAGNHDQDGHLRNQYRFYTRFFGPAGLTRTPKKRASASKGGQSPAYPQASRTSRCSLPQARAGCTSASPTASPRRRSTGQRT